METIGDIEPSEAYVAFMGDVVGSREVTDRAGLQRRLVGLLEELNHLHGEHMVAPLRLVRGDEFQGLLHHSRSIVPLLSAIEDGLHPVRVTFGVGLGGLSTDPGPDVGALDGPVFHRGREALEEARHRDVWARVRGFGAVVDSLVDSQLALMEAVRSRWTETQRRYARGARTALQREVAREFGVSESTVSKSLTAARFNVVIESEEALARFLDEIAPGRSLPPWRSTP